jgi:uncharacterized protein DUF4157
VLAGATYARSVDTADTDKAVELERTLPPVREPSPPDRLHDAGSLGRVASEVGNRGFGRIVARMREGAGLMPGGLVHPDVEAAIAAAQGAGRPLERSVAERLEGATRSPLRDVQVHTGKYAAELARSVEARAFTVGRDIFFGAGEYQPHTSEGRRLIAHEVAHVVQQRGAPQTGPLTVSQPGDAPEREAETFAGGSPD